jgi:hypothetical protein
MGLFHTAGCRINWTTVSQGAQQDVITNLYQSFQLRFGFTWDTNIRINPGQFNFHFTIFDENGSLFYDWVWRGWTATELPSLGANAWVSYFWPYAIQATGRQGFFQFRPSVYFQMGGLARPIRDEFAVAEEPHFFVIESG